MPATTLNAEGRTPTRSLNSRIRVETHLFRPLSRPTMKAAVLALAVTGASAFAPRAKVCVIRRGELAPAPCFHPGPVLWVSAPSTHRPFQITTRNDFTRVRTRVDMLTPELTDLGACELSPVARASAADLRPPTRPTDREREPMAITTRPRSPRPHSPPIPHRGRLDPAE